MLTFGSFSVTGNNDPERVKGARLTASLFPLLGITPAIGRPFTPAEDSDDVERVVILGDGLWRRRYGGDPSILGRPIDIEGSPWTVIGIMPRGARLPGSLPGDSELWLPMRLSLAERINERSHNYTFVGRLADGATLASASTEFETLAARLATERPSHAGIGGRLIAVSEQSVRTVRPALVVAAASVALLLLVSTANASTLLIARASHRRTEHAVRAALGASSGRLLSQSLVEGVLLAAFGAVIGVAFGGWTLSLLLPLFGPSLPASAPIEIGPRTALFSAFLAITIGLVFGVIAAFRPGHRLADAISGLARTSTASPSVLRARHLLVVSQVAVAVALLSAAGLMLSSVAKLSRVSPGFDPNHVLTFGLRSLATATPSRPRARRWLLIWSSGFRRWLASNPPPSARRCRSADHAPPTVSTSKAEHSRRPSRQSSSISATFHQDISR